MGAKTAALDGNSITAVTWQQGAAVSHGLAARYFNQSDAIYATDAATRYRSVLRCCFLPSRVWLVSSLGLLIVVCRYRVQAELPEHC
jgi:hypothetical protein